MVEPKENMSVRIKHLQAYSLGEGKSNRMHFHKDPSFEGKILFLNSQVNTVNVNRGNEDAL